MKLRCFLHQFRRNAVDGKASSLFGLAFIAGALVFAWQHPEQIKTIDDYVKFAGTVTAGLIAIGSRFRPRRSARKHPNAGGNL